MSDPPSRDSPQPTCCEAKFTPEFPAAPAVTPFAWPKPLIVALNAALTRKMKARIAGWHGAGL